MVVNKHVAQTLCFGAVRQSNKDVFIAFKAIYVVTAQRIGAQDELAVAIPSSGLESSATKLCWCAS